MVNYLNHRSQNQMNSEEFYHDKILLEYREYCYHYCKTIMMLNNDIKIVNIKTYEDKLISLSEWYGAVYGKNLPDYLKNKSDIKFFILNELVTSHEKDSNS
jgi:hypothetical protein